MEFPHQHRAVLQYERIRTHLVRRSHENFRYTTRLLNRLAGLAQRLNSEELTEIVLELRTDLLREYGRRHVEQNAPVVMTSPILRFA